MNKSEYEKIAAREEKLTQLMIVLTVSAAFAGACLITALTRCLG